MGKIFTTLTFLVIGINIALAQKADTPPATQAFGKIDKADLELTECSFEKDANAMVLFDKGEAFYDDSFNIILDFHKRIKIFSDAGKKEADVRLEFRSFNRSEYITGLQVQTINLNNGKIEITKIDRKQIFTENVDKYRTAMVFSFPNVKAGSVIEFSYRKTITDSYNIPDWYFQAKIPVRYSEFLTSIPEYFDYRTQNRVWQPYVKNASTTESRTLGGGTSPIMFTEYRRTVALANIKSLSSEPYMGAFTDNLQHMHMQLEYIRPISGFTQVGVTTWAKAGGVLTDDEDFGMQFKRKLISEEALIAKAKALKTDDEKIAYLFNEVKNSMKWDGSDRWYTVDGTSKAWEKKIGNSTEINLILYRLLKQSGVKSYPMVVSTREHGRVNPVYTFLNQFNRAVVYIPVDSTKHYVLDASNKYNSYLETPDNLLNSYGLWVDKDSKHFDLYFLERQTPVRHVVVVNAEIDAAGKMNGTAQINNFSYDRSNVLSHYKADGEKKYIDYLRENNNSLVISALKLDNMEDESQPLTQNLDFKLELTGSDKDYIYFNPNLFTSMRSNPFLSESRSCDVDFGYLQSYSLNGTYKVPAGYKIEGLPKNINMVMPDKSITFRRIVAEQDGSIVIRYLINMGKAIYFKEDYADFHAFYKKMHELLNEQVVLKKS